jgi:hypothetical protein
MLAGKHFIPGDWAVGTLADAHKVGFYLIVLFLFYWQPIGIVLITIENKIRRAKLIPLIVISIALCALIILSDPKHIILAMLVAMFLYLIYNMIGTIYSRYFKRYLSLVKIVVVLSVVVIIIANVNYFVDKYNQVIFGYKTTVLQYIKQYIYSEDNKKVELYKDVFVNIIDDYGFACYLIGTGPGTLGSRAANSLATSLLYKETDKKPAFISSYASDPMKRYMRNKYTKEYYETIQNKSAVLAMPFAGIASIKGELGLIGLCLYILFILSIVNSLNRKGIGIIKGISYLFSLIWFCLFVLMLFDNYQEKPQIMYPLYVISAVLIKTYTREETNG